MIASPMIKLVLAEAELEPVPRQLRRHPSMKRSSKGKDTVLLDSNYHHRAMRGLDDAYRRGRPDITHICLLNAMESPLNKRGELEFYVHTRNDEVIFIDPSWKVPKSYNRFVGLMESLFEKRVISADGTDLLRLEHMGLVDLVESIRGDMDVKVMHYEGSKYAHEQDCVIIVGGFPHGDFVSDLPYDKYTIYEEELVAWAVINTVIYHP